MGQHFQPAAMKRALAVLTALVAGCGRTELGEALGFDAGAAGSTSSVLVGPASIGAATFGTDGTTGFTATTAVASTASSVTNTAGSSAGAGGGPPTAGGAGGTAGAAGACAGGSCDSSWSTPELIETDDLGSVLHPRVAMNRDGAAVVAWTHLDGARKNVWVNRYTPGGGWAGIEWLAAHHEDRVNVRVAIDEDGTSIVIWHAIGAANLWSARHRPGAGWAAYDSVGSISVAYPDLAVGTNTAMVLWPEYSDPGTTLWSRAGSSSWDSAIAVRTNVSLSDWRVAMNGAGAATVVWREWEQDRRKLWASRWSELGWTTPEPLQPDTESGQDPDAAMDPEGNVMVVWHQWKGSGSRVAANRFSVDSGWGDAETIDPALLAAQYARVGVDDAGNAVAIWQQADDVRYTVWTNRYSPATGWGKPEPISVPSGDANRPEIAVSAAGDAVAVWTQLDPTGLNLWSNRYTPGSGWGTAELVAPGMLDGVGCNDVAIDGAGTAIAVWCHAAGGPYSLWSSFSSRPE